MESKQMMNLDSKRVYNPALPPPQPLFHPHLPNMRIRSQNEKIDSRKLKNRIQLLHHPDQPYMLIRIEFITCFDSISFFWYVWIFWIE